MLEDACFGKLVTYQCYIVSYILLKWMDESSCLTLYVQPMGPYSNIKGVHSVKLTNILALDLCKMVK